MEDGTLLPGQPVDDFDILRTIGIGSFGTVYEADWRPYARRVALKMLHSKLVENVEARARFRKEAEAAAEVHHAHIVEMLSVGEFQGVPYVVMELLHGETLADMLRADRRMSVEEVMDIMLPVLSAVSAIHDTGMVHRDLKPANIFLSRDARQRVRPIVLDFGIVKVPLQEGGLELTRPDVALGTPCYMSPEQVRESRNVGPASDQFSLGVILYYALTRVRPFQGETRSVMTDIVQGNFVPPSVHWPAIPPVLNDLIVRTLANDPARRFASLRELGQALLPFASKSTRALWSREFQSQAEAVGPSNEEILGVDAPLVQRSPRQSVGRRSTPALVGAWLLLALGTWSTLHWGLHWTSSSNPQAVAAPTPPHYAPSPRQELPSSPTPLAAPPATPPPPIVPAVSASAMPTVPTPNAPEPAPSPSVEALPMPPQPAPEVEATPVRPRPAERHTAPHPIRRPASRPII